MNAIRAYPLQWPTGRPRTARPDRNWHFAKNRTLRQAIDFVKKELAALGAKAVVISSNVQLRQDGEPMSGRKPAGDAGVAVYFQLAGEPRALCCDCWDRVEHNLWAVGLYVEATRAQLRNGVATAAEAFAGFKALPAPDQRAPWWKILGVSETATLDEIRTAYRRRAAEVHPDRGGHHDQMAELNGARDEALKARGAH